jgi:hypothetical protein
MATPTRPPPDADDAEPLEEIPAVLRGLAEPITSRPDGYYWQTVDGRQAFGPFATYEAAFADMHAFDPDDLEPGESLQEAESEIGISVWIDPETGDPAEGLAPPHLEHD